MHTGPDTRRDILTIARIQPTPLTLSCAGASYVLTAYSDTHRHILVHAYH